MSNAHGISRRSFLKLSSVGIAGGLLAACAPASPQAPAASSTSPESSASPTEAPAEAATGKIVFSSYTWSGYEAAMKQVLDMWKAENPGVEVEGQFVAEDYGTKLQTQIAAGTTPDVGIGTYQDTVRFAKQGVLLPLDDLIARDKYPMEKFLPGTTDHYSWQEGNFAVGGKGARVFGLPSDAQGYGFAYNKKMFDEAGVSYPTDDWTWDDLLAAAKAITKPDEEKYGIGAPDPYTLNAGNFRYAGSGEIATPDWTKSLMDSPETIAVYKWIWDLTHTHKVSPPPRTGGPVHNFLAGRIAMTVDGIWWVADFKNITEFDWDLAQFPKHPTTGKRTTSIESDGWWVFKSSKEPELSWSLTKFLASETGQRKFGELEYVVPSSIADVAKEWYARKPPESRSKAFENLQQDSRPTANMFYDFWTIWGAVNPVLEKAFLDGENIEPVMQEAAKVMNEELDKAWANFKSS